MSFRVAWFVIPSLWLAACSTPATSPLAVADGAVSTDAVDAKGTWDFSTTDLKADLATADANPADGASEDNGADAIFGGDVQDVADDAGADVLADAAADFLSDDLADAPGQDDAPADGAQADLAPDLGADLGPDVPILTKCPATLQITAPLAKAFLAKDDLTKFIAQVTGDPGFPVDTLQVQWQTATGAVLGSSAVDKSGKSQLAVNTLPGGLQTVSATIVTPVGMCTAGGSVQFSVCAGALVENFDAALNGKAWKTAGDASWDPGGWLEMTGNVQSKLGFIYSTGAYVQPGDASMHFSIQTGSGINGGADGFAVTLIEAKTLVEVEAYVAAGKAGGCLGYGVAPPCGTMKVTAFHIEFDTFHNTGDPNIDPIYDDHIGIMLNGDASDHKVTAAIPDLEDFKWHDVRIDVEGTQVTVFYDGVQKASKPIESLDFRGGYVVFSGSTGWATNYHRIDNLKILHQCK